MNILETIDAVTKLAKASLTLDLQAKIAELKQQAIELTEQNTRLRAENLGLTQKIETLEKGERCPKCMASSWKLIEVKPNPNPLAAEQGLKVRVYSCLACEHLDEVYDRL